MDYTTAHRRDQVARRLEASAQAAELPVDTWLTRVDLPDHFVEEVRAHAEGLRTIAEKLRKSALRARRNQMKKRSRVRA